MGYIYDRPDWPAFRWDTERLVVELAALRFRQGAFLARMEGLGFGLRSDAVLRTLTEDVLKTSEIEGEVLDRGQVRSSLARRLGMDLAGLVPADRNVDDLQRLVFRLAEGPHERTMQIMQLLGLIDALAR